MTFAAANKFPRKKKLVFNSMRSQNLFVRLFILLKDICKKMCANSRIKMRTIN